MLLSVSRSRSRSRRLFLNIASALVVLIGVALALAYGWLLVNQPDNADQLTASIVIAANIILIVVNPLAGLLVWLFLTPLAPVFHLDLHMPAGIPDLGFSRMVGSFLFAYLLTQVALGKRRLARAGAIEVVAPLFVLTLVFAGVRSTNGWLWGVQTIFEAYVMPLLAYFLARNLIHNARDFDRLGSALLAIGAIIAFLAILEQTTGIAIFRYASSEAFYQPGVRKVGALLGNPAYIALALAIITPIGIHRMMSSPVPIAKVGFGVLVLLYEAAIFLTYNRSGWLGGLLVVVVMAFSYPRFARLAIPAVLVACLFLALVWGSAQDSAAARRLGAESPIDYRFEAIDLGLRIFKTDPILGVGWGSFGRIVADRGWRPMVRVLPTPHNTYLNFLVSGGAALLGSYLLLAGGLGLALARAHRAYRLQFRAASPLIAIAWASAAAYYASSIAFDSYFALYANLVLWAILGAVLGAVRGEAEGAERRMGFERLSSVSTGSTFPHGAA